MYKIINDGIIQTYSKYEDIPLTFDHLIEFAPEYPKPPHTKAEHDFIAGFGKQLAELMLREKDARSD